jgi:sugar phosphate isomerase/epimerase
MICVISLCDGGEHNVKINEDRIFYHVAAGKLLENMAYYMSLGVNLEIYINSEFIDHQKPEQIAYINEQFKKNNVKKRIHGPFLDLAPASPDAMIRDLSRRRMLSGIDVCQALKCDNIVLHSHYDPVYHKRHMGQWEANSGMIWKEVCLRGKAFNVTVNIENSEDDNPEAIFYLMKTCPAFKACFDLAHYTVFGSAGWKEIFKRYPKGSINEVHLSDNDTREDQHLVLGEGSVEVKKFLDEIKLLGNSIAITVEPHSDEDMVKDIAYMRTL